MAQRIVRIIRDGVRHPDIDGQVLPGRRVIREIAVRPTAVLEDDVVQVPLPPRFVRLIVSGAVTVAVASALAEMCATIRSGTRVVGRENAALTAPAGTVTVTLGAGQ